MYVENIMTRSVLTAEEGSKITHIAGLMQARRIRHLPVVDAEGNLVGILSHRDVQKASPSDITTLSAGEVNYLLSRLTAKDIMHRDTITCPPDTLVEDAASLMREKTIGCLPVVDGGKLVGIITSVDLLDFFLDITGVSAREAARVAIRLEDRQGSLSRLLTSLAESGGTVVSVITPQHKQGEREGTRTTVIRYLAADTSGVSEQLRSQGYEFVTEHLPDKG